MSSSEDNLTVLQYVPFNSFVHNSFWHALMQLKLNVDQLEETTKELCGRFTYISEVKCVMEVDGTSFNGKPHLDQNYINMSGTIFNKNTSEEFRNIEKHVFLNSFGEKMWSSIKSKDWIRNPSSLLFFFIISFSDLKKLRFYYWFAFPTPSQPAVYLRGSPENINSEFSEQNLQQILDKYKSLDTIQKPFFIVLKKDNDVTLKTLSEHFDTNDDKSGIDLKNTYFCFADPSCNSNPGWPLRIYIAALLEHCPDLIGQDIKIIGIRYNLRRNIDSSYIYKVNIPQNVKLDSGGWVGWERNNEGTLGPKLADMSTTMDPVKLADTASNLNIQLMKWRLTPDLDIDIMKSVKCLLLGAGTLGCHVARNLLAWGFRHVTFIDNGRVSFSNPCRQCLFTHQDSLSGGSWKAEAAARNLALILPTVESKGIRLHVPMPGHPVGNSLRQETLENIDVLAKAIQEHDVIFLLLDTREARWLPTLIGAYHEKIVINAALGFDSYLVMRHGVHRPAETVNSQYLTGSQLGCYFCNDVTAPGNSLRDRTLDQQCTVTRPGAAAIAGALAVEMLMGLLQHPLRVDAPAAYNLNDETDDTLSQGVLGPIPHSIRGFLHSYQTVLPTCPKFKQCIACSDPVINQYKSEGTDFLFKVFDNGAYLEELTGLKELHIQAQLTDVMTFSDESD